MNKLEFFASLVHSLAWPATVLTALYLLRDSVGKFIIELARRIRTGNISVEGPWGKATIEESLDAASHAVQELTPEVTLSSSDEPQPTRTAEDSLELLAIKYPEAAVVKCWDRVENALRNFARQHDVSVTESGPQSLIDALAQDANLDQRAVKAAHMLLVLRNSARRDAPGGLYIPPPATPVKRGEALYYIATAQQLIDYLETDEKAEHQ